MDYDHIEKVLKVEKDITIKPYTVSDKAVGGAIVAIRIDDVPDLEVNPISIEIEIPNHEHRDTVFVKDKAYPLTILGIQMKIGESLVIKSGISGEHIKLNITERYKEN